MTYKCNACHLKAEFAVGNTKLCPEHASSIAAICKSVPLAAAVKQ